jgi:hypothetical protein
LYWKRSRGRRAVVDWAGRASHIRKPFGADTVIIIIIVIVIAVIADVKLCVAVSKAGRVRAVYRIAARVAEKV